MNMKLPCIQDMYANRSQLEHEWLSVHHTCPKAQDSTMKPPAKTEKKKGNKKWERKITKGQASSQSIQKTPLSLTATLWPVAFKASKPEAKRETHVKRRECFLELVYFGVFFWVIFLGVFFWNLFFGVFLFNFCLCLGCFRCFQCFLSSVGFMLF